MKKVLAIALALMMFMGLAACGGGGGGGGSGVIPSSEPYSATPKASAAPKDNWPNDEDLAAWGLESFSPNEEWSPNAPVDNAGHLTWTVNGGSELFKDVSDQLFALGYAYYKDADSGALTKAADSQDPAVRIEGGWIGVRYETYNSDGTILCVAEYNPKFGLIEFSFTNEE